MSIAAQANRRRKAYITARHLGDNYTTRRGYNRSSGGPSLLGGKISKTARKSGAK